MKAAGICGSDVHYLKTLRCADFIVKESMFTRHECDGVIEEVGSEVKHFVAGDHVPLEPVISNWRCSHCKQGSYNLCPDMKFFATLPVHGFLANQLIFSLSRYEAVIDTYLDGLEASGLDEQLASINLKGFLTINSQPPINGAKSDLPTVG